MYDFCLLCNEKLDKTVHVDQPKAAKVQITGNPSNSLTVKMEFRQSEGEASLKWLKVQLTSGASDANGKLVLALLCVAYILFKKKYYHLHEEYLRAKANERNDGN